MTGQDWIEKDFYKVLGVPKDADQAAIKKAYRKKARELHPDQNPGDAKSEAKFKEVGEAYAVLSDVSQRQQYDQLRAMAGGARFSAGPGGGGAGFEDLFGGMFGAGGAPGGGQTRVRYSQQGAPGAGAGASGGGFEDLLGGLFGGGRAQQRGERGADLEATTTLPFREAVDGSTVKLSVSGRTITARIPAGVRDGQKIRLAGKGRPGSFGGPAGDLVITVKVTPHPVFTLDGNNVRVTVPVTFDEATLGAQIEVPALDGSTVRVKIAEGTPSGRTLRVKGKGITTSKAVGDLLVTVQVVVPQRLDGAARKAVEAFRDATAGADPRADLLAQAKD